MQKAKYKLRKKFLSKKEPGFDDLGNSQLIQFPRDEKIKTVTPGKHAIEKKPRMWLDNLLIILQRD